jgi:hypothetical protein
MAIPEFVNPKLRLTFGAEATESIMTWMDDIERQRDGVHELRSDMKADFAEVRQEMQVGFARMEALIERRISDLMKWSFVFWVGAVVSIALLAKLLP